MESSTSFNNDGADFSIYTYKPNGDAACDTGPYTVTNASWSSGTATLTFSGAHTMMAGWSVYIYGMTPSGYNCLGQGCVLTAVNQGSGHDKLCRGEQSWVFQRWRYSRNRSF